MARRKWQLCHIHHHMFYILVLLYICHRRVEANPLASYPTELDSFDKFKLIEDIDFITDSSNFNETSLLLLNVNELIRKFMIAGWRMPVNDITAIHQYDNLQEKLISGGPNINRNQCTKQLDYLLEQANVIRSHKDSSFLVYNLFDSYGRPEAGLTRGAWYWLGDYNQCKQSKLINTNFVPTTSNNNNNGKFFSTRYCLASIRWPNWLNTTNFHNDRYTSIKTAICIPETCDSLGAELEHNRGKIHKLMEINFGSAYENFYISSIYCLPDEQSQLTDWKQNNQAIAFVLFFITWLFLVTVSTLFDLIVGFDHYHHRREQSTSHQSRAEQHLQASRKTTTLDLNNKHDEIHSIELEDRRQQQFQQNSNGSNHLREKRSDDNPQTSSRLTRFFLNNGSMAWRAGKKSSAMFMRLLSLFSLLRNAKILFNLKPRVNFSVRATKSDETRTDDIESPNTIENATRIVTASELSVDLEYLNGFKTINMLVIAMTHLFLLITLVIHFADTGEMFGRHYFYYLTIAGLCVNNFIHITGMLTSFILLKRFYKKVDKFWLQPSVWFGFAVHRYLRLVPLWAILVWYTKAFSKYTGSGPLWEYSTSNTSRQYYCEQETWAHTFLASANFVRPYESCICSGWYLATDIQYALLVTPIFMILLMKSKFWSFIISNIVLVALLMKGLMDIANSDYNKPYLNKQTNVVTSVFVRELGFAYTEPYYRVGFYFLGLITGCILYMYGESKEAWANTFVDRLRKSFVSHGLSLLVLTLLASFLPVSRLPPNSFVFGWVNLRMFLFVVSMLIQMYLLSIFSIIMATSRNRLVTLRGILSFRPWKITSRMCLTILLVNPIVIQHFYQLLTQTYQLTYNFQSTLIITIVFWTYFISMIVHLILELPLCSIVDLLHKMM